MQTDDYLRWQSIKAALSLLLDAAFQTPRLKRLRANLEEAHKEVDKLFATQSREQIVRSDGEMIERQRETLREDHLLPISKEAAVLLDGMPGIADSFRVPHKRMSDADLFDATKRVLANAERYEQVFTDGGWDKDFIAQARAAADALKAKLEDGDTVVSRRSRATHSIPDAVRKGRKIMVAIDRTVAAQLKDNQTARELWKRAMRIPKKAGRPKNNRRRKRPDPPPE